MVKRTATKVSIEGVDFAKPTGDVVKGVKAKGAWRYPGGIIQRAPTTQLGTDGGDRGGGVYTDDKDHGEARRKHESNFFITLNTNRYVGDKMAGEMADDGKQACKKALDFLSQESTICAYLKFGPKSAHYRDDRFADVITKIEWQAAVETGENKQRLHCHIWLTLHHYSQVQVNMPMMQKLFKEAYNGRVNLMYGSALRINGMPYIQVKLLPSSDWATVMKQYIHKGMQFSE